MSMCRVVKGSPCQPHRRGPCWRNKPEELTNCEDVVAAYIRDHRLRAACLLRFFRECPTLEKAIEYAALCKFPSGKRHPHQYRIPKSALPEAERSLLACMKELRNCHSFAELHQLVRDQIGGVTGIGALTIYDVAHHLGAYLRLPPKIVYLHAGTAVGAKALGHARRAETLEPAELPAVFGQLSPDEIEDCLCIYQEELQVIGRRTTT